jgi:hypothetical protein
MTVVCWDGKTLAADKRMTLGCHVNTVTKIARIGPYLVGFTGHAKHIGAFRAWLENGANPESYPKVPTPDEDMHALAVKNDGTVWKFEGTPFPTRIEDAQAAAGSGRDYARAAMHLGCDARRAVEVACEFDENCGNGVDTLTFDDR